MKARWANTEHTSSLRKMDLHLQTVHANTHTHANASAIASANARARFAREEVRVAVLVAVLVNAHVNNVESADTAKGRKEFIQRHADFH